MVGKQVSICGARTPNVACYYPYTGTCGTELETPSHCITNKKRKNLLPPQLARFWSLKFNWCPCFRFFLLVSLGLRDSPKSEDAALSLPNPAGNFAHLEAFDQLQRHGKIQCEKIGNVYLLVCLQ